MEFKGKVVLITGGTKNIGRAISLAFGKEGAQLVVNFRNDYNAARDFSRHMEGFLKRPLVVPADLTKEKEAEKLIGKVITQFRKLDILINNAGIPSPRKNLIDTTPKVWRKIIDSNLHSVYYMTRFALREMLKKREGVIINVSSSMTRHPMIGSAPYSCSKAALEAFTRVLAKEVAPFGIRVNAVAPGMVASDRAKSYLKNRNPSFYIDTIPLRRLASSEEIAEVVKFLASKKLSYITGEVIYVDGGDRLNSIELFDFKQEEKKWRKRAKLR